MNRTDRPYRFHAFDVSYFSAKVRPALRYKQLWYEELRADLGLIRERTGLGFIPVLITPEDEVWQDSTEILDRLEARHPEPALVPSTPLQGLAAHLVELYVDEFCTIPAMHYRWGSELGEATARARFSAMTGSEKIGNLAADRMVAGRFALGASDEAAPAIEAHLDDLLGRLNAHFETHPYLLGDRMSVADCALMGPFYAHLFVDIVPRRLLLERAVPVVGWIERCSFPGADGQGEWLAADRLATSLRDVLRVMGKDAAPVVRDGLVAFEAWVDASGGGPGKLPRSVGTYETVLRGTKLTRTLGSYPVWMIQRSTDAYAALPDDARARVDEALAGSGWEEILRNPPRHRVEKRGFDLFLAGSGSAGEASRETDEDDVAPKRRRGGVR